MLPGRKRGYATGKDGQLSELRDQLHQLGVSVPKKVNSTGKETKNYGKCPRCRQPDSQHPKDECFRRHYWKTKDEIKEPMTEKAKKLAEESKKRSDISSGAAEIYGSANASMDAMYVRYIAEECKFEFPIAVY